MNDSRQRRRKAAPRLERLETREVQTFMLVHHASLAPVGTVAALAARNAVQAQALTSQAAFAGAGDTSGTLTPHEIKRQTFVGRFKGNYTIGAGRTTDQALQLTSLGYGGANQSYHLWTNMRITVPSDPTKPVTGVIYIISWNVGTTGTQLFLDLTGDPTTAVNGIPTHYTWEVDPASSGIYTNAAGYGTGSGTMDIKFFRPSPGPTAGTKSGKMNFSINGLIDTSGNFNVIGVLGNKPNGKG